MMAALRCHHRLTMRRGAALYLPKGAVHAARTDTPSVHLNFALRESRRRWFDVLHHAIATTTTSATPHGGPATTSATTS